MTIQINTANKKNDGPDTVSTASDACLRAQALGGKDPPSYIYIMRNSGDQLSNILTFMLRDALISEIQFQSHPDDMPTEQFKLNFTEIVWQHAIQMPDTKTSGHVSAGWSLTSVNLRLKLSMVKTHPPGL